MQDNYFEAYNKYKDGVLEVLEETSDFYKQLAQLIESIY